MKKNVLLKKGGEIRATDGIIYITCLPLHFLLIKKVVYKTENISIVGNLTTTQKRCR